jgi:predicted nucleic acid-binding protein
VEELVFGVGRLPAGARRQMLEQWLGVMLARFTVLPYDGACARWLGAERARLAALGKTVSRADGEIAAVAVLSQRVLVTRNVSDFQCFSALQVEDWFERGVGTLL